MSLIPKIAAYWVGFMLRIRENPNSDFGPDTGYTLSGFCSSSSVLLGIYWQGTSN